MPSSPRSGLTVAAGLAALLLAATSGAAALSQPPCPGATPPRVFVSGLPYRPENLHFAGGGRLLVSSLEGDVHLFSPDGASRRLISAGLALGAMATGPDGAVYLAVGNSVGGGRAAIWRVEGFTPPVITVHASGLDSANGLALASDGTAFVGPFTSRGIVRVPAAQPSTWHTWAPVDGANGLALDEVRRVLYATLTFDQSSTLMRIPLADPGAAAPVARLSFGAISIILDEPAIDLHGASDPTSPLVPKGLDDLAIGPDGMLYAAAHEAGEILRVDPDTGEACVLASGLHSPSSVRFARDFGPHHGRLFITQFGAPVFLPLKTPFDGAVLVLDVPPVDQR
jgi:sugar lactone lactonase YvrE